MDTNKQKQRSTRSKVGHAKRILGNVILIKQIKAMYNLEYCQSSVLEGEVREGATIR